MSDVMAGAWNVVSLAIGNVLNLGKLLYQSFGVIGVLSAVFFMWQVNRFLLAPILGGGVGSSDFAVISKPSDRKQKTNKRDKGMTDTGMEF